VRKKLLEANILTTQGGVGSCTRDDSSHEERVHTELQIERDNLGVEIS